eukprot:31323-Pelagococcus_subviridis.AAC.29
MTRRAAHSWTSASSKAARRTPPSAFAPSASTAYFAVTNALHAFETSPGTGPSFWSLSRRSVTVDALKKSFNSR